MYLMSSSANTNTLPSIVHESGMEPQATLRELVEQSEPEPYVLADPLTIPTENWGDPGFGEKCISKATLRKLARDAATCPGTRTAFITPAANPSNGPKTLSEELDWHIFNRRLLIRLYDADFPNPEACTELKQVKWKTERYHASFASTEDLQRLSHIRVLEEFLAGSVARREARKAANTARTAWLKALKTEPQQRLDAIRATWPEPKFQSLDHYMNDQHELSERIWNGTVDTQQLEQVTTQTPDSIDPRPIQARNLQKDVLRDIQTRVASKLVDITAELGQLRIIDEWMRNGLNEEQTAKAKQLVVVNSMLSSLGRLPTELPSTENDLLNEEPATEQQEADPGVMAQPDLAQAVSSFQGVNWEDIRPFTPAAPAVQAQTATHPAAGVQERIDSIVQASTPPVPLRTPSRSSSKDISELSTPDFVSSSPFMGFYHQSPSDPGWPYF